MFPTEHQSCKNIPDTATMLSGLSQSVTIIKILKHWLLQFCQVISLLLDGTIFVPTFGLWVVKYFNSSWMHFYLNHKVHWWRVWGRAPKSSGRPLTRHKCRARSLKIAVTESVKMPQDSRQSPAPTGLLLLSLFRLTRLHSDCEFTPTTETLIHCSPLQSLR